MIPIDTGLIYYVRLYEKALALYQLADTSLQKAEAKEAQAAILLGFDSNLFTVIKRAVIYPNGVRRSRELIYQSRKLYREEELLRKKAGAAAKLAEQARVDLNPLEPVYPESNASTKEIKEPDSTHPLIDLVYSSINRRNQV